MNKIFLTFLLVLSASVLWAQTRTIKGTVFDNEKQTMIGASVIVKQDPSRGQIGTITDFNGNFELKVPSDANTLIFSFIGFITQEVNIAGKSEVIVTMEIESTELDAVVVTALGIKKEKKALGYAFTDIKGDDLVTNRDVNFVSSLSNKIAGVNISQTAGGPGTSSRIVIRGVRSVGTESQPLIVVDGVPMDNSTDGATWLGGVDYGNSLASISPDDIESMSVLKGPNAAALYGSRGANGVILITTKKGKAGKMKVTLNSNFMINTAYIHGKYQNEYGLGFGGGVNKDEFSEEFYNSLSAEDKAKCIVEVDSVTGKTKYFAHFNYGTGSWGPKMPNDTLDVLNWNGEFIKLTPQPDNVKDYFNTGFTFTNSIGIESGTEKFNWRLSVMDLENKGLKPNSKYGRTSINYLMTAKASEKVTTSFKANYIKESAFNRVGQGDARTGARTFIWMPRSINMDDLREDYKDENGYEQNWYKDSDWHTNPFWEAYENYNNDDKNQFVGFAKVNVEFTPWLSAYVRSSMDTYQSKRYSRIANKALRSFGRGYYNETWKQVMTMNHDFLITANKSLTEELDLSANLGGNLYKFNVQMQGTPIDALAVPNFFSINNPLNQTQENNPKADSRTKEIQSVYGTLQLSYKNWLYVEGTARNDWSSSLPSTNWSYFYPSVNTSVVLNELLGWDKNILSFAKVRASYAEAGNDTDPHQLSYQFINQGYGQTTTVYRSDFIFDPELKSERTKSFEFGTDFRLFQNRLGIDFTYYNEKAIDQIMKAEISSTSGAVKYLTNGGIVRNKGVELQVNATPIELPDFSWDVTFNYARNRNEVVELYEDLEQYRITGESQVDIIAVPGRPYGEIIGKGFERNTNGEKLVDENGLYIMSEPKVIGNITPDWTGGLTNSLKYKDFTLSFSIGIKIGGDIFSKTNKYGLDNGQFVETLEGRESWYAATQAEKDMGRKGLYNGDGTPMLDDNGDQMFDPNGSSPVGIVADGVLADGSKNTKGIDPQVYFHQHKWGGIAELDVYDASFVKLRDVTLNWNMPSYWFENIFVSQASLSLVANNVWLIYSGVPNIDPEQSFSSGNNGLGQEYAAMPPPRSFGFNLKLVF